MYLEFSRSPRGFVRIAFADLNGKPCSIEQADIATNGAIVIANGDEGRVTLAREHVASLMPILSGFLLTGRL